MTLQSSRTNISPPDDGKGFALFENPNNQSILKQKKLQKLLRIFIDSDDQSVGENKVWISTNTFRQLYPNTKEKDARYLQVAHFIYALAHNEHIDDNRIGINDLHYVDLNPYTTPNQKDTCFEVQVRPVDTFDVTYAFIENAYFKITTWGPLQVEDSEKDRIYVDVEELSALIKDKFALQFFQVGQSILVDHPKVGQLCATLAMRDYSKDYFEEIIHAERVPRYGRIRKGTTLHFASGSNKLTLSTSQNSEFIKRFHFQIIDVIESISQRAASEDARLNDAWKRGVTPLPLVTPLPAFNEELRKKLKGISISPGEIHKLKYNDDWSISLGLFKVDLHENSPSSGPANNYTKRYSLEDSHNITLYGSENVHVISGLEHVSIAHSARFVVTDWDSSRGLQDNETPWVSIEDLERFLIKKRCPVTKKGTIVAELPTGKVLLKLESVAGAPGSNNKGNRALKNLWVMDENTSIRFRAKKTLGVKLVDTAVAYPLKMLEVNVSLDGENLAGSSNGATLTIFEEKELKQQLLEEMPPTLCDNHVIYAKTDQGIAVTFTVKKVETQDANAETRSSYGRVYSWTPNTTIELTTKKDSSVIIDGQPLGIEEFGDVVSELKAHGLGGFSDECIYLLQKMILSYGEYREYYQAFNIKPEKGAILYGPPGTGKTSLLRLLGKFLGAKGALFILVPSTKILNMYVGNSEQMIRDLFMPAREVMKNLKPGQKPPMCIVGFDEFDAIAGDRSKAKTNWEKTIVTTLLSEIDGIGGEDGESLDNIFVVGLTNNIADIDPALLRSGRFGAHIEIGIPNSQGRRDILNIHLKEFIERDHFAGDPEEIIDWLVEVTIGKTGAFIQELVQTAFSFTTMRLHKERVPGSEARKHPQAKLTKEDFIKAYRYMHSMNEKEKVKFGLDNFTIPEPVNPLHIKRQLLDLGVGGVPKPVIHALQDIMLTRQEFKTPLQDLGYQFPRGLLLYGPKGSGKSMMVGSLPKLFGLDGDRFQRYQASDLWQQHSTNLRKEIRNIFEPAMRAAQDLGDESPLYIVAIEGFEKLYELSHRYSDNRGSAFLSDFLSELDDIFKEQSTMMSDSRVKKKGRNLLVVATITSPNELSPDFTKYGLFGIHVQMGYPDFEGRQEIFGIYLKSWIERGLLHSSITLKNLANLVEQRRAATGDYIQGLVTKAITYPVHRAKRKNLPQEEFGNDEVCLLTMDDFRRAIEEMETDPHWETRRLHIN